ncbi:MAG: exonuclease [Chloroflexi bacterium]|nr:exonuclease [Chloroflexota bacterium]
MVTITCYGGVNQVGGNQLLLEDGEARLFLDFGTPYSQRGRFYEEYLKPRSSFGLLDPLAMGLLPSLRGLYRQDMEQGLPDLWAGVAGSPRFRDLRDTEVQGVLLSHAHLDHAGYISFLRRDIPIVTSALTAFVAKAVQDSGRTDFESEVVYAVPRELKGGGLIEAGDWKKVRAEQRPFQVFGRDALAPEAHAFWQATPGARGLSDHPLVEATRVGGLEVRRWRADHSVPGASSFAVKSSGGWIAYTGDIRLAWDAAGSPLGLTRDLLEALANLKPAVLLCEGTRAGDTRRVTEAEVHDNALAAVRPAQGLVIADFGPRNVERLLTFAKIARTVGRALVVLPRDAYLLQAAHLAEPSIPSVQEVADLQVYDEPKLRLDRWERAIRDKHQGRMVSPARVQEHQSQFILCFSFFDLDQLPTIQPGPGSLYLYSSHEAFNEDLQLDFRRLRSWIDHFGMRHVGLPLEELQWAVPTAQQGLHASGHASGDDLIRLIQGVKPQVVIPIHTEHPGFFLRELRGTGIRVVLPRYGVPIHLEEVVKVP